MFRKSCKVIRKILFYLITILFVGVVLLPFVWQFLTSIKPLSEISAIPAVWLPSKINVQYYINIFTKHPFVRYLLNSLYTASVSTVISLMIGSAAGYSLSRLHFRGKKFILMAVLGISMFPTIATISPLYLLFQKLGLTNTYLGLIIPYVAMNLPMAIWLFTNYFSHLPKGFEESAAIDGCSRLRTFFSIMLPLIKPGIFSVGMLVFISSWSEFLYALTFMTRDEMRTVPVGISLLPSEHQLPWGDMAAASIAFTVPLIIVVLIFQKRIISGMTTGGVKG